MKASRRINKKNICLSGFGGLYGIIDDSCGIAVERNSVQGVVAAIDTIISQKGIAYTEEDCVRHAMFYDKEVRFEEYIREVYEGM